jgi:hypothetical protein
MMFLENKRTILYNAVKISLMKKHVFIILSFLTFGVTSEAEYPVKLSTL